MDLLANKDGARVRVLHVVESFGGGVASSLSKYVQNTPEYEHHLIAHVRPGDFAESGEFGFFTSTQLFDGGLRPAVKLVRQKIRDLDPDVVHAHSSFGGAFARLAVSRRRVPIVYTPHGFSFERRDLGRVKRSAFFLAEYLLSMNASIIAACSPREEMLARRLRSAGVVYVPNVAEASSTSSNSKRAIKERVVGLGRLTAARDPQYFSRFARALRRLRPNAEVVWIGGGSDVDESILTSAGVTVTGWLTHAEAMEELASGSLYAHPAAWDGFPMAILEAHSLGLGIVARASPALEGAPGTEGPAEDLAALAAGCLADPARSAKLERDWSAFLKPNTDDEQRRRLRSTYELVIKKNTRKL